MARFQYVIDRFDTDKDPSEPLTPLVGRFRLRSRSRPHRGHGFRVRSRTGEFGHVRGWRASRVAAWKILQAGGPGTRAVMRSEGTGAVFGVTKVVDEPTIQDLGCAPELERIHAYVVEWGKAHGGVRSGGRWYCRYVLGSRTVSRHGYRGNEWLGAAEDWFVVANTMSVLFDLAYYLVGLTQKGHIFPHAIVVGDQEWRPGEGWTHYGGEYHRHVHIDVPDGYPCHP
jgi:hypothetical protein